MSETLDVSRRGFEEAWFAEENQRLLRQMLVAEAQACRRSALAVASGLTEERLLDRLIALDIAPDRLAALVLAPLVLVAWSDGTLDPLERAAILKAAAERHVAAGSPAWRLLEGWLEQAPLPMLFEAWAAYARSVLQAMAVPERAAFRSWLLRRARAVAEAASGFLGLGWTVSPAEAAMLQRLEAALAD
ncbi:hypothetical protein [Paracraurococcus lichenis]|uniref:TerB family tellurite resistance protein n=1 Tax=Paracraurococcus lichenis TaxID=3064888 RepID=A0ABT9EAX5_9PROT|nr:hypothetical protein [Paracraurococcus sp. LOR1-02]MDO9713329.1 hypothetical protein [Paracraurococcus sp. LOR1-02]